MDFQKCKKKIQSSSETEDAQLSNLVTLLSKCSGKVTENTKPTTQLDWTAVMRRHDPTSDLTDFGSTSRPLLLIGRTWPVIAGMHPDQQVAAVGPASNEFKAEARL